MLRKLLSFRDAQDFIDLLLSVLTRLHGLDHDSGSTDSLRLQILNFQQENDSDSAIFMMVAAPSGGRRLQWS